jgi:hypothetical protein
MGTKGPFPFLKPSRWTQTRLRREIEGRESGTGPPPRRQIYAAEEPDPVGAAEALDYRITV